MLADWQQRVVDEEAELKIKLTALTKFSTTEAFKNLPFDQKVDLLDQAQAMCAYGEVLVRRISKF